MSTATPVTPLERSALLAAYQAPNHTLPRMGNGFVAAPVHRAHSGPTLVHSVTKRMALRLQRADLVQLDDDICPSRMTLTGDGCALARQLIDAVQRGRAMTTSRCERIRAWLATQSRPATAHDVLQAVEPGGDINAICASLSAMDRTGLVQGAKLGARRYYTIGRGIKPRNTARPAKTGRANRVREWIAAHDRGYTVGELRAALDPGATASQMSASLHQLAQQGHIARATAGHMSYYARTQALADHALAHVQLARVQATHTAAKAAARPAPAPKPREPKAKPAPKPAAPPKAKPKPAPKAKAPPARAVPRGLPTPPPPGPAMRAAMDNSARATGHMRVPPRGCSLNGVPDAQYTASARIAADIAAFEARGGRIEQLGPTQFFSHIGLEAANHTPPRRPRTGTHPQDS